MNNADYQRRLSAGLQPHPSQVVRFGKVVCSSIEQQDLVIAAGEARRQYLLLSYQPPVRLLMES